jgi:hypothetical protein
MSVQKARVVLTNKTKIHMSPQTPVAGGRAVIINGTIIPQEKIVQAFQALQNEDMNMNWQQQGLVVVNDNVRHNEPMNYQTTSNNYPNATLANNAFDMMSEVAGGVDELLNSGEDYDLSALNIDSLLRDSSSNELALLSDMSPSPFPRKRKLSDFFSERDTKRLKSEEQSHPGVIEEDTFLSPTSCFKYGVVAPSSPSFELPSLHASSSPKPIQEATVEQSQQGNASMPNIQLTPLDMQKLKILEVFLKNKLSPSLNSPQDETPSTCGTPEDEDYSRRAVKKKSSNQQLTPKKKVSTPSNERQLVCSGNPRRKNKKHHPADNYCMRFTLK